MHKSQAYISAIYRRTVAETLVFWLIWVLTLIPIGYFLFLSVMFEELLLLPFILLQLGLHGIAIKHFLNTQHRFFTSMLWLVGGTCIVYILFLAVFFLISVALHSH